ncbi:MAG: hypothetical protein ACXWVA_04485 [Rhodoplanes sp.]
MIGDKIDALLGDKGRDADAVREALKEIEVDVEAIIPSKSNRKQPIEFDRQAYKQRNLMEPGFNKLKNWPRIATRYDKSAAAAISSRSASVGLGGDKPAHDEDAGQLFRPHSERCVRVGGFRWVSPPAQPILRTFYALSSSPASRGRMIDRPACAGTSGLTAQTTAIFDESRTTARDARAPNPR